MVTENLCALVQLARSALIGDSSIACRVIEVADKLASDRLNFDLVLDILSVVKSHRLPEQCAVMLARALIEADSSRARELWQLLIVEQPLVAVDVLLATCPLFVDNPEAQVKHLTEVSLLAHASGAALEALDLLNLIMPWSTRCEKGLDMAIIDIILLSWSSQQTLYSDFNSESLFDLLGRGLYAYDYVALWMFFENTENAAPLDWGHLHGMHQDFGSDVNAKVVRHVLDMAKRDVNLLLNRGFRNTILVHLTSEPDRFVDLTECLLDTGATLSESKTALIAFLVRVYSGSSPAKANAVLGRIDILWSSEGVKNLSKSELLDLVHCPVCKDVVVNPVTTNCLHTFCSACLEDWLKKSTAAECPLCRTKAVENFTALPAVYALKRLNDEFGIDDLKD